jgi:hypothetical protein
MKEIGMICFDSFLYISFRVDFDFIEVLIIR